jgi:cytochrome c peroxidase
MRIAATLIGGLILGCRTAGPIGTLPPAAEAPAPPAPIDNPTTSAKIELGRRLFYDADLSINGTMSCTTCHGQRQAFTDGAVTHGGALGDPGRRNVPSLTNVAWAKTLTWGDSRVRSLEQQASIPISGEHPVEMGMAHNELLIEERLGADRCYREMFRTAFPEVDGKIGLETVTKALASFERTFISFDSPYDRYLRGDHNAIPAAARRGAELFGGAARCTRCHAGPNLTDGSFHALVSDSASYRSDRGLGEATGMAADDGKFRTPMLRNVALTAPYLHDGSAKTLDDAIKRHRAIVPEVDRLSAEDTAALIVFLHQLTDSGFVTNPRYRIPRVLCGVPR